MSCEVENKHQRMEIIFNKQATLVQEIAISHSAEEHLQPLSKEDD